MERPEVAALHMSPVPRLGSHGPGGCGGRGSRVLFWWLWDVTGAEEQLQLPLGSGWRMKVGPGHRPRDQLEGWFGLLVEGGGSEQGFGGQ